MKLIIRQSCQQALQHWYLIIVLFLYQLLWGLALYHFVDRFLIQLLQRIPQGSAASGHNPNMLLAELQFLITKTNVLTPYLVMFGALLLIRMFITPVLNAGLFYSLQQTSEGQKPAFLQGIRSNWGKLMLLYFLQWLLIAIPGIWLLPRLLQSLLQGGGIQALLMQAAPWLIAWLLWSLSVYLFSLALQLCLAGGSKLLPALLTTIRQWLPYIGLTIIMWLLGMALSLGALAISLLWTGLLALIWHQASPLLRTFITVWTFAVQRAALDSGRN